MGVLKSLHLRKSSLCIKILLSLFVINNNFFLSAFCFLLFAFSSCKETKKENSHIFHYNQSSGISSLDPAFAKDQSGIWICNQLFNGLVQLDDSLSVKSAIAQSWEISDSGKTYIFHLRKDVFFHDDECFSNKTRTVNAYDFVYSFERIIAPKTASPGAWIFNEHIAQSAAFTAIDSFTFQIKLRHAFVPLMGILTMQYCSVIPHEAVEFYGLDFRAHPVGTGAFQFKKWKEGVALILVKNPNYFESEDGKKLPFLDGIRVSFITDKKAEFLAFRQKQLDFISGLDASYIDEVLTDKGELKNELKGTFLLDKSKYLNTEYLGFNLKVEDKNSPILNTKIRQAVNYGINRKELIQYLRNGIGKPAENGFVPEGLPSFNAGKKVYEYNPAKAAQLIEDAGYNAKNPLPEIALYSNETYREIALMVAKQLSLIGIKIKIEINPSAVLREWMTKGKAPFFRGSWIADYPDAESYYAVFYGKNIAPPNYTRFNNAAYDRLYETALRESNEARRYALYREMDKIIAENAPVVPLYYDEVLHFYHANIHGLSNNALNLLMLKNVRKDW